MFANLPLLSLAIWTPILGGLAVLAIGNKNRDNNNAIEAKVFALLIAILTFILTVPLYVLFNLDTAAMQFVEKTAWIALFNINYYLGIDGISMPLIILTSFITIIVILAGWGSIKDKVAQYLSCFLIMEGLMIGVFAALDAILFYVFWEAMLIPMFLVIGIWGGPNRIYATLKFFIYTFLGSVLMLVALLYLHLNSGIGDTGVGSFSILDFHQVQLSLTEQRWIFIAFLIAFAVKVPMWPVHTWLPDAHVEAPTGGSVILAAIMLKLGAYGFLRFSLPITPDGSASLSFMMIMLSLIAVVYIGFVALVQQDMKKLIAYSSISHMGFVTLGFFIPWAIFSVNNNWNGAVMGIEGAMVQMISHGFISGAMFLCVGVLYDRLHSRMIKDYGGVVNTMPTFAAFMLLFAMANAGLPGTSGFVGEFMVIISALKANFWYAFFAALTLIIGASYTLWMVKRVIFGSVIHATVAGLHDIDKRELGILSVLALMVLFFGVYPAPLIDVMHSSVEHLVEHISISKIPTE